MKNIAIPENKHEEMNTVHQLDGERLWVDGRWGSRAMKVGLKLSIGAKMLIFWHARFAKKPR